MTRESSPRATSSSSPTAFRTGSREVGCGRSRTTSSRSVEGDAPCYASLSFSSFRLGARRRASLPGARTARRRRAQRGRSTSLRVEGAALVRGEWRYSDTRIIESTFRAPGTDGQTDRRANTTYDYTPHAGGADFDDSQWEVIGPATSLDSAAATVSSASTGIASVSPFPSGRRLRSDRLDRRIRDARRRLRRDLGRRRDAASPGQSGGSVVRGWNAPNRLVIGRDVKPGQKIQLAVFGINGPLSNPPTNFIWVRDARLEFHSGRLRPDRVHAARGQRRGRAPRSRDRRDRPAESQDLSSSPKASSSLKVRSGCAMTGYLLFSDPNSNTIYKYCRRDGAPLGLPPARAATPVRTSPSTVSRARTV